MTEQVRYGYLSQRAHRAVCFGLLMLAGVMGGMTAMVYNALFTTTGAWPYEVLQRKLVSATVRPGGEIGMLRLIEYSQENCWRQYDRRAVSQVQAGDKPGYVHRFDPYNEQRLPVDLSGKWQTWSDRLPDDFTCGPAYLAETVTVACTWWERYAKPLRKPDVLTPFNVACEPGNP